MGKLFQDLVCFGFLMLKSQVAYVHHVAEDAWSADLLKGAEKINWQPLPMLVSLEKKKASIIGSGTGIGEAIAYRLAEAGLIRNLWILMKNAYVK